MTKGIIISDLELSLTSQAHRVLNTMSLAFPIAEAFQGVAIGTYINNYTFVQKEGFLFLSQYILPLPCPMHESREIALLCNRCNREADRASFMKALQSIELRYLPYFIAHQTVCVTNKLVAIAPTATKRLYSQVYAKAANVDTRLSTRP